VIVGELGATVDADQQLKNGRLVLTEGHPLFVGEHAPWPHAYLVALAHHLKARSPQAG
jgi:hypothetical protein